MFEYPQIPGSRDAPLGKPCVAFQKYDGSNLRWEWRKGKGFVKFGTRHGLFDRSHDVFGEAPDIFLDALAPEIERRMRARFKGLDRFTAFTEFLGPRSFAGTHHPEDPKALILFDAHTPNEGLLTPREFLRLFESAPFCAARVHEGNMSKAFIERVRAGDFPGFEGVICKGQGWMAKIKTRAFLERLKSEKGEDWERFAE